MQDLVNVVLPVFLVVGFGAVAVGTGVFSEAWVDGLMKFTQNFAFPCLLFRAISTLDLSQDFSWPMLAAFYCGAALGFLAGLLGGRFLFGRPWEDSVAFGFIGLFSNSLMLGVPITERAFGAETLTYNFMIVALHAPVCYGIGMTMMEIVRHRGGGMRRVSGRILKAMFRNALVIGIALGFVWNFAGLTTPLALADALDWMARAGLPAALFGLGGVIVRYRPAGDLRAILYMCGVSLILHPMVTFGLTHAFGLSQDPQRAAVMTAAMAPGVNAYVFANMYGVAKRVAASSVLLATAATIVTSWIWLLVLG